MITSGQLATHHSPAAHKRSNTTKKVYNKKTVNEWSVRKNKEANKSGTAYYSPHNSYHKSSRRTQNNNENSGNKMNAKLNCNTIMKNSLHNSKTSIENIGYDNNTSYEDVIDKGGKYLMKNAQNHHRPCGRNQKTYFESYQRVQSTDSNKVFSHGPREKYESRYLINIWNRSVLCFTTYIRIRDLDFSQIYTNFQIFYLYLYL